ncbi:hypothetical protein MG293_000470 [Ovis ammon polii]|uniref:Uncharacterized protein n=1 Tax=Ovis ammon polii TaxID=230172 RepID=A0AAD4YEL2_OVIAM|nr:hypothetical protein MG293_000470 [Ovis ammon polii]
MPILDEGYDESAFPFTVRDQVKQVVEAFLRTQYRMANMRSMSEEKAKPETKKQVPPSLSEHQGTDYEMEMNKPENGLKSQQTKRGEILEGREKSPPADELNFVRAKSLEALSSLPHQQGQGSAWSMLGTKKDKERTSCYLFMNTSPNSKHDAISLGVNPSITANPKLPMCIRTEHGAGKRPHSWLFCAAPNHTYGREKRKINERQSLLSKSLLIDKTDDTYSEKTIIQASYLDDTSSCGTSGIVCALQDIPQELRPRNWCKTLILQLLLLLRSVGLELQRSDLKKTLVSSSITFLLTFACSNETSYHAVGRPPCKAASVFVQHMLDILALKGKPEEMAASFE